MFVCRADGLSSDLETLSAARSASRLPYNWGGISTATNQEPARQGQCLVSDISRGSNTARDDELLS